MKEKNTEISERIEKLLNALGENPNSFSKVLGYNRSQAIYDIIAGKAAPSFDFFSKLYNSEYSEKINIRWIITGDGEMLLNKSNSIKIDDLEEWKDKYYKKVEELDACKSKIIELQEEMISMQGNEPAVKVPGSGIVSKKIARTG